MILGRVRTTEADRGYGDPYPIHTPPGRTTKEEALARHLRARRGVRIAVGRTTIPEGWTEDEETAMALEPNRMERHARYAKRYHLVAFCRWKREKHVGKRTNQQQQ